MNWKDPFVFAFELGMSIIGWSLVLVVIGFGVAVTLAFIKAMTALFTGKKPEKKKKTNTEETYETAMNDFAKTKRMRVVKDEE